MKSQIEAIGQLLTAMFLVKPMYCENWYKMFILVVCFLVLSRMSFLINASSLTDFMLLRHKASSENILLLVSTNKLFIYFYIFQI